MICTCEVQVARAGSEVVGPVRSGDDLRGSQMLRRVGELGRSRGSGRAARRSVAIGVAKRLRGPPQRPTPAHSPQG